MEKTAARFMVSAVSSGVGKTTLAISLLAALKKLGHDVSAFKSGPDFIDPMFHSKVLKVPSRNLDLFLTPKDFVINNFAKHSKEISLVEGAMGYYDGIGSTDRCSSYDLSVVTKTPVILVVSPSGSALSTCATIKGFLEFRKDNMIKGVIFNKIRAEKYEFYKNMVETNLSLKVFGFLPDIKEAKIKSRHLGLMTAGEVANLDDIIDMLASEAIKNIDIKAILDLAKSAETIRAEEIKLEKISECNVAIARDDAFCFYYQDNIDILEALGAKITYFSPIYDKEVPEDAHAVYIGGGYPELHLEKLAANKSMLENIKAKAADKMPIFAECGGFMYLHRSVKYYDKSYELCNILGGSCLMGDRLSNFGYFILKANHDNMLARKGEVINAHEFHYSLSDLDCGAFTSKKASNGAISRAIYAEGNIFAGYPHINFFGNMNFAINFIKAATRYKSAKRAG